jgi:hypothetical protein
MLLWIAWQRPFRSDSANFWAPSGNSHLLDGGRCTSRTSPSPERSVVSEVFTESHAGPPRREIEKWIQQVSRVPPALMT